MKPHLRPLLSSLWRNPLGAVLVALQVAITLAILVNVSAMVSRAVRKIEQPTGLDTRAIFVIPIVGLNHKFKVAPAASTDLAYLRALPDVVAATVTFGIPLTAGGSQVPLARTPGGHGKMVMSGILPVDQEGLRALAAPLIAGRNFRPDEITTQSSSNPLQGTAEVIVTRSLAHALFPRGDALGRTIYFGSTMPLTIIGITRDFMGPQLGAYPYDTILLPRVVTEYGGYDLLVRARPGERNAVLRLAKRHIGAAHQNAVIDHVVTLSAARWLMYAGLRNMVVFLVVMTTIMLIFCCFGIFGLGAFNVASRTKQIGIRRAIGARRRDVVVHFMMENALVLGAGMALGSVLALAIGQWLSDHDGVPRLDPWYLLAGILVLGLVAQLAAWQPARRAARVPPSVATRSV